jgi:hypothetical protein
MTVKCNTHGDTDGFIVCRHVAKGEPAITRTEPSRGRHPNAPWEDLGEAICALCAIRDDLGVDDLMLICRRCLDRVQRHQ